MWYQSTQSVSLRTIKSILKQTQRQHWLSQPLHATNHFLLGNVRSRLKTCRHLKALFGYTDEEVPNEPTWWQENIFPEDKVHALVRRELPPNSGKIGSELSI